MTTSPANSQPIPGALSEAHGSARPGQSPASQFLDRGFRLEQAGTATRAAEAYRHALTLDPTPAEAAEGHLRLSRALRSLAQWDEAIEEARDAERRGRQIGDEDLAAEALNAEAGVHLMRGDYDVAESLARCALVDAQSARVRGITLQNLGYTAAARKEYPRAKGYFADSLQSFRESGYELGIAVALNNAAAMARDMGDARLGLELSRESAAICRRLNALNVLLAAVQNQARALVELGSFDEAEGLLTEALGHFTSAKNIIEQAACLESLGDLSAARRGDTQTALRCYQRALDLAAAAQDRALSERLQERVNSLRSTGDNVA